MEIFHDGEWGAICNGDDRFDRLTADVVCRQLGFPHGNPINPAGDVDPASLGYNDYGFLAYDPPVEEAEEPLGRFWLDRVSCNGPEQRLADCDLGAGFLGDAGGPCADSRSQIRFTVACRSFPVPAALEEVTTPGAGVCSFQPYQHIHVYSIHMRTAETE